MTLDRGAQRTPRHELHHDERARRADRAVIEHGHDVRMREAGGRLGLALEPPQRLTIAEPAAQHDLHRHRAGEA